MIAIPGNVRKASRPARPSMCAADSSVAGRGLFHRFQAILRGAMISKQPGRRRGDLISIIWHDGQGAFLFTKRLERGRFLRLSVADGVVTISVAQLSYLLSGIDWRMPQATWRPQASG